MVLSSAVEDFHNFRKQGGVFPVFCTDLINRLSKVFRFFDRRLFSFVSSFLCFGSTVPSRVEFF